MDEIRIYSEAKADGWVTTTYNNLLDTANFYTVGSEELSGTSVTVSVPATTITVTDYSPTITGAVGGTKGIFIGEKLADWVYYFNYAKLDNRYMRKLYAIYSKTVTVIADYTPNALDHTILVNAGNGAITINLPAVDSNTGRQLIVKKIDSSANAVTIDGSGDETIDGSASQVISLQYESLTLACDGSAWYIV
jgi:hypothetical protein